VTNPRHAHDTDRGRYYRHPLTGQQLVSVTNVLSTCVAKQALIPWAAKITAEFAIENLPTIARRLRTEPLDDVRKDISRQVTVARDKAGDLGTRVHDGAERHVLGTYTPGSDPDVEPYVQQYLAWLDAWGVDITEHVEATEITVADPGHGYAGTADLRVRLPLKGFIDGKVIRCEPGEDWQPWLIDFKSSATRAAGSGYDEYVLQLAALRYAKELWLPDDTVTRLPPVAGAAVLNLRTRSHAFIPVDAGPEAHRAFLALLHGAQWLHGRGKFEVPVDPPGTTPKARKTTTRKRAATTESAA
jgi:hypothetical protein